MSATNTYQPVDLSKAIVQIVHDDRWKAKGVEVAVLRLDRIHPVLSGNKWFKLKYHLQQAMAQGKKGILTFGGAWSNHLVATAIACKLSDMAAIGVVRGEAPAVLSNALLDARMYDMQLQFVSRQAYSAEAELIAGMEALYPDYLVVPQGGQSAAGVQGASEITSLVPGFTDYSHIACAAGTGTMLAGIVHALAPGQEALGFSSLKLANREDNSLLTMVAPYAAFNGGAGERFTILYDYHFGGYARTNAVLNGFMNDLYKRHHLPTDIVYTGKLMYGINDLIHNNYFKHGARILAIQSGGLQGNRSLPAGTLCF